MLDRPGICPKCGSPLVKDEDGIENDRFYFFVSCPECPWDGREIYRLEFEGFEELHLPN